MDSQDNILSIIRGEINDFMFNDIEVVPGYTFNQYNTIKRCHLYLNSKFEDDTPYQGMPKFFDNKIKPKRDRVVAFLNIDTKDIKVISRSGSDNPYKTLIAQKELDYYLKDNDYAQKLNDMAEGEVDFGSVVIKKTKNGDEKVDLRRMFNDPTVSNLQKSRFLTFKYLFTPTELREKIKDGWDEEVIETIIAWKERQGTGPAGMSYETNGQVNIIRSTPYIEIYERFGEVKEYMLKDDSKSQKFVKSVFITAEPMSYSTDDKGQWTGENGGILFKSKWNKDYPVDESHYYQTPGRWLGIGIPESLFLPQERINELANQKRVSMELSTLHLFQTPDTTIVNNVLSDLQNGDLIQSERGITPIANEERNLSAFQSEEIKYQQSIDAISFVSPQASGEQVPGSTPATNAVIQNNNTLSVFNFKRQNFANFVRRYLRTFVLKDLLTKISTEHVLRFVGDYESMMKLNIAVATSYANADIRKSFLDGKVVTPERRDEMIAKNLEALKGKSEIHLQVTEGWFDDVDLDFDILIDNEQQSTDIIANNTWQVIQALSANPQALENPVTRALIFDYAEKVGINPTKLEGMAMAPQQQGQSMPQPQVQQSPVGQGATVPAQVQ